MAKKHAAILKPSNQAERIIMRFGNSRMLSRALARAAALTNNPDYFRSPSVIYRWTYPRSKGGTDGTIPNAAMPGIIIAARYAGIFLTDAELKP